MGTAQHSAVVATVFICELGLQWVERNDDNKTTWDKMSDEGKWSIIRGCGNCLTNTNNNKPYTPFAPKIASPYNNKLQVKFSDI